MKQIVHTDGKTSACDRMIETLKTLRLLHQVTMLVAAVVLVFGLTPDEAKQCNSAVAELVTLREVPTSNYVGFLREKYKDSETEDNAFLRSVIREAGIKTRGHPHYAEPLFSDTGPIGSRLLDYDAFFRADHSVAPVKLNRNRTELLTSLRTAFSQHQEAVLTGISFAGGDTSPLAFPSGARVLQWSSPPRNHVATLELIFNELRPNGIGQPSFYQAPITYDVGKIQRGPLALDWLRSESTAQGLIDPKTGEILPALKKFWDRVGVMDFEQATLFLQQKLESLKGGTVAFFGISVRAALVIWVGPLVCALTLLFLCLNLQHFRMLTNKTDETVRTFPWVALFPGRLSGLVTYLSVLVVPISANVVLLYRYGNQAQINTIAGDVLALLTIAGAVWACVEIWRLRQCMITVSADNEKVDASRASAVGAQKP